MRTIALFLAVLQGATPLSPPAQVTVEQLEQFLASKRAAKESDSDLADRLMRVQLSEELTPAALARIGRTTRLRPKTLEELRLLRDESVFEAPPAEEWLPPSAPDAVDQRRILSAAESYASTALAHLPDFIAVRTTTGFDNAPQAATKTGAPPSVRMHFVRQHRREVAYRRGAEVDSEASAGGAARSAAIEGFTTHGEFGPTLNMVLRGASKGSIAWSRWQRGAGGARLAVFRYSVPRPASEYLLDLCCFPRDVEDAAGVAFRDRPAYHGEIFIQPESGVVERLTLEADLPADAPVRRCSIEVEYGVVNIDAKPNECPVRGVAVLVFFSPSMAKLDDVGLEKHINEVRFDQYHKFGSTARMIP